MPHSKIQVEHCFILQDGSCQILNFAQNPIQNQRGKGTELHLGGVTPHLKNIYTYFLDVGNNWSEEKTYTGRGDTAHTLLMWETIGVGTAMPETFQTPGRQIPDSS